MKKILLICTSYLSTSINENMSDVYFANGILTEEDAQKNFNFRSDFLGKNYE
jgi:5,10-methenyltetrahydromethanopterin hydrogenase